MIRVVIGHGRYARQVKVPGWMLFLMGGAAVLVSLLLLTFLASLALFAIPAIVIGALAARWFGRSHGNGAREPIFTRNRQPRADVIEGEYRVLGEREPR